MPALSLSTCPCRSINCRRELYAAVKNADKHIIVVHEADESKGGASLEELRKECEEHCGDDPEARGYDPAARCPLPPRGACTVCVHGLDRIGGTAPRLTRAT